MQVAWVLARAVTLATSYRGQWRLKAILDYFRRLAPTPDALRNGRLTFGVVAAIYGVILALMVVVPEFADTTMVTIMAASMVTLVGTGISYLGQPTLTRYRVGLILAALGIVVSFWMLVANPFVSTSG